ncbi:unnamed protein product [Rhodiola kirilowii]
MADPNPNLNLRSVADILRQSHSIFTSHLLTFLSLSLLIFIFRTSVETGTQLLTSFVDRDPSLQALLSRLQVSSAAHSLDDSPFSLSPVNRRRRRNRPFLQLTRVGTLENDFFADDDDEEVLSKTGDGNRSFVRFGKMLGFSGVVEDNGVVLKQVVRNGVTFDMNGVSFDGGGEFKERNSSSIVGGVAEDKELEGESLMDQYPLFLKNLDLGSRDSVTLFFLVCFMSAAYGWVILGFLMTYSWVFGIVFVAVVKDLLGKEVSFLGSFLDGCRLGMKRLSSFILLRWAIRDAFTQLLGLWYFGEIEDQYSFFRLFVRLKLMPFSVMSPWGRDFEKEIFGFVAMWFLIDASVSFVFSVVSWVVIVNVRRRGGREMVKEGCYLLSTMLNQAIMLKCLEYLLTGSFMRNFVSRICGKHLASYFQAAQEVYFIVAWLLFYLAARCQVQYTGGRVFGRRDLEGFAEDFR